MVYTLRMAGVSDVGRIRERNEDRILLAPPMGAVADGMGGHLRGDRAAQAVIDSLAAVDWSDFSTDEERIGKLESTIASAQSAIQEMVGVHQQAGSTVAGVQYCPGSTAHWLVFHIGDSRVYLMRGGALTRLTRDHSHVQELIDEGVISENEARTHPARNALTRAIAARVPSQLEVSSVPAEAGDVVVVCSDGLTDELTDADIAKIVTEMSDETTQSLAYALRDTAITRGGHDNISAVIMTIGHEQ
ncbi:MAG: protein phosphatase 2C domain-containing protein [Ancrocorticia sp.]